MGSTRRRSCRVWSLLALVALFSFSLVSPSPTPPGRPLTVDVPVENEYIRIDGPPNAYRPIGLEPHWTYEMRVSFVSTRSAQIHFGYDCQDKGDTRTTTRNRRLLHAEKLVFSTDESGRVRDHPNCLLTVRVTSLGQMRHETDDFFYDVVLEKNLIGIPLSGLPLIAYALVLVAASVALAAAGGDRLRVALLTCGAGGVGDGPGPDPSPRERPRRSTRYYTDDT